MFSMSGVTDFVESMFSILLWMPLIAKVGMIGIVRFGFQKIKLSRKLSYRIAKPCI